MRGLFNSAFCDLGIALPVFLKVLCYPLWSSQEYLCSFNVDVFFLAALFLDTTFLVIRLVNHIGPKP